MVLVNCTSVISATLLVVLLVCVGRMFVANTVGTGLVDFDPYAVEQMVVDDVVVSGSGAACAKTEAANPKRIPR